MPTIPPLLDLIADLIGAPSVSSVSPAFDQSNRQVIDLLASWLDDLGFSVEVLPLSNQPHKANLIATLGRGPGGLVLAGHTDTVPFNAERWSRDPFRMVEHENRLYGLGTCDMKSFLALAIEAARGVRAADLHQPLIILATADEESSMDGASELVRLGRPRARYAVIGEPTSRRPVHAHKGMMMEAIRVSGRAGHSSDPRLGASALEGMHKVLGGILAWRTELQSTHSDARFAVPFPTLNLGRISGGDNPNRICAHCELHIDLRPLPGMQPEGLRTTLRERVDAALADSELGSEVHPLIDGTEPMETPPDAAIVTAAEQLTGYPAEAAAYCTEGPYLNALGMQTVILGPGNIEQAHKPDEFIETATLRPTIDTLRALIDRFCRTPTA
ncbi:MAG: acetylornithine deacetylase [Pseudomonadota bacterium]|nr:MAG: acetylornithine deacetylase [Pseudomonadota bacterium]